MERNHVIIFLCLTSLFGCALALWEEGLHNPVVRTEYEMKYQGVSYPQTQNVDVYVSTLDIPYLYDWIGDIARYGASASYEETMKELRKDAMKVGAHAVIVTERDVWNQTGAKMIRGQMFRYRMDSEGEPLLKSNSQ